jgi:hypothetical protein
MKIRGLAVFAVLVVLAQGSITLAAQVANQPGAKGQTPPTSVVEFPQNAGAPTAKSDCQGSPCEYPQPRITVAYPTSTAAPWTMHERIAWAANLVLVVLGYVGIMLAVSTLKKIEGQLKSVESVAGAAVDVAQAALLSAQAVVRSERPWILIAVEPSPDIPNSFTVVARNRGRTPAKIVGTSELVKIAIDESYLPKKPEYEDEGPSTPRSQIILLPGESMGIKSISRDDLKGICWSEEMHRRVENWEEKVYLYGKILYQDLIDTPERKVYETAWCCWYIHGRQKSGLVIAGPPEYNQHT